MITNRKMIDALRRELEQSVCVIRGDAGAPQVPACADPPGALWALSPTLCFPPAVLPV